MKLVEIVSHCWCPPGLDQYAQMLRVQAASLLHWPPKTCRVRLTVCHGVGDALTDAVITEIKSWSWARRIEFCFLRLPPSMLFRRAIGRNLRATDTDADVVFFTDVDYFFVEQCLADIWTQVDASAGLCMPSSIWIHRDHETGDAEMARMRWEPIPAPDLSLFVERRQKIAIGGVQILGGDWARANGYLRGTRWVEPVSESEGFRSCRCDKAFRSHNQLSATRLPIRGVYRMRHTRDGRDFDSDGAKIGKGVW